MAATMAEDSKGRKIGYWITTVLTAVIFGVGGVVDLIAGPEIIEQLTALGYPAYLARLLGVAKVLGAIAILAPKFPRLKEWAYAGICFDLIGAAYSHTANGDGIDKIAPPLVFLLLALGSYFLRPSDRKLD